MGGGGGGEKFKDRTKKSLQIEKLKRKIISIIYYRFVTKNNKKQTKKIQRCFFKKNKKKFDWKIIYKVFNVVLLRCSHFHVEILAEEERGGRVTCGMCVYRRSIRIRREDF